MSVPKPLFKPIKQPPFLLPCSNEPIKVLPQYMRDKALGVQITMVSQHTENMKVSRTKYTRTFTKSIPDTPQTTSHNTSEDRTITRLSLPATDKRQKQNSVSKN
ncbi:hypothetical protein ROZALSC1DRAFT_25847 [Rozella allomycis CSF55]|uniref:Uncharacterized protein n=1 Tax=Rozella allomycis (strain CSF55) TaxID=988480 RepID=A0A4P9Y9R6_ROZAC|nr:hypothetical protein ROZALSC1DRAFT_25847 [Rozella allomycis CSF55]